MKHSAEPNSVGTKKISPKAKGATAQQSRYSKGGKHVLMGKNSSKETMI